MTRLVVLSLLLLCNSVSKSQSSEISNLLIEESIKEYNKEFEIDDLDLKGLYVVRFASTTTYDSTINGGLPIERLRGVSTYVIDPTAKVTTGGCLLWN